MTEPQWLSVETPDSRMLEVLVEGPADGFPLVYHSGTPSAAVPFVPLSAAATRRGLRTITYSRPGYGESTPHPGRSVADATSDVSAVLAAVGADSFITIGWSGGGPHALACAALMPQACRAAATVAGAAPYDAPGLAFLDAMGEENIAEFGAAVDGEQALTAYLSQQVEGLAHVTSDEVAAALGDLVSDVDRAALTGELAEYVADGLRRAVLHGVAGWREDDLAFVGPWGFEVASISVPVAVWQGRQDRMVPFAHGSWLAAHVPGSRPHLYDDEGHLSFVGRLGDIVDDLARLGDIE